MNSIFDIKVNLQRKELKISYTHPATPSEDLSFEICQGNYDLNILKDFLSASFPQDDFTALSDAEGKRFCRFIYKTLVQSWLKKAADAALIKASGACHV